MATNDRGVVLIVSKADKDAEEHWPRLLKASGKTPSNIVSWELFFFRNDLRVFVLSTFLSHSFFFFLFLSLETKNASPNLRKSTGTAGRTRTTRPRPWRREEASGEATTREASAAWISPLWAAAAWEEWEG